MSDKNINKNYFKDIKNVEKIEEKNEDKKEENEEKIEVKNEEKNEDKNLGEGPTSKNTEDIELQYGDVIQIFNPINENLDKQIFIIDYIDKSKIILINTDTFNNIKLNINENGILGDGNITKIILLSRADEPSYAKQNGLIPGKWINIYFGGDLPVIITGYISNLEEDMIEITTNDNDVIYINFDYKGIPEELPIENIEIREKPIGLIEKDVSDEIIETEKEIIDKVEDIPEMIQIKDVMPTEKLQIQIETKNVKDQIREFVLKADQIQFGDEELGSIKQFVDVDTISQRYSIESQVTDLLDELLSTIPNIQRTPRVLNNIHIMIERFKQLREKFSIFNNYGIVEGILIKATNYKPLSIMLQNFNLNLYWLLPVVKNIKKIYDVDNVDEEKNDIVLLEFNEDLTKINELLNNYKSNNLVNSNNKYSSLYSELNNYFTPFNLIDPDNSENIIIEKQVLNDINVVIDNLEDMYSSIFTNDAIRSKRFVISKYNLALSKLDTTNYNPSKTTTIRTSITRNDIISLKSILTLPEPVIRFSKINLPGTNILDKSHLNNIFINYWQILKRKTNINNVFIDSLENELELDEISFASNFKNYILNISDEELAGLSKEEIYNKYINIIVPKIKIIFKLMKKYINGKLSIINVISYLEPFLIYSDDLTYNQYKDIVQFIDIKISEYNKSIVERSNIFKMLLNIKPNILVSSKAYSIIEILDEKFREEVVDVDYGIHSYKDIFTNSELLNKFLLKDYSRLYTTTIAYQNLNLNFPNDISTILEEDKKKIDKVGSDEDNNKSCNNIVISKMYSSLEQLQNDDDKVIYFDKKYDKTNYGIMEDKDGYMKEVINLTPEELREFIIRDQIKKNKLSEYDANYLADTLINGVKKVIDGQYALLYKGYAEKTEDEIDYYIRKDNKWVIDKDILKRNLNTDEDSILCNLQEKCMTKITKNSDKCETMELNKSNIQNNLLNNLINEFDVKYKQSKEEFEKEIREKFEYFKSILPIINNIENNNLLKYNNNKYNLGINIDDENKENIISPYSPLLNIILGQKDFPKKQFDLLQFIDKFTRPSLNVFSPFGNRENEYMLYCIKTNIPLIPVFKKTLAHAFIHTQYKYNEILDDIKSKIGQLSDDGNWWTDKYTGWPICPGDFSVEEGFEEGFKVSTRSIMEEEAGSKIIDIKQKIKYITPEAVMINNIINVLCIAMGINIESQKEFIINNVIESIKSNVENESDYKEKVKQASIKGKNLPSYRDFFNTSLLYFTLGMFLIGIQSAIPSIKTRKTHPGCIRSFSGYPFEGNGDLTSLIYLACVVYDIRSSGEPYNVLKRSNIQKIQTNIKASIDNSLLLLPEVQRKFEEKTQYLLINPNNEIPEEHDISNWYNFLPPLVPFKIRNLLNISSEFKNRLNNEIKSGSKNQREKICVIDSKIIQFSLAIQEKIQDIVKKQNMLLYTSGNQPYLENACCNEAGNISTYNYFNNINNEISEFNNNVKKLTNIIDDITYYSKSQILFSNINTKNIYPILSYAFDEKTIYLAFIIYCKFKSLVPIPEDLLPLCSDKPENFSLYVNESIEKIIKNLKDDGRSYSNTNFLRLIQLVSRNNIIGNINSDEFLSKSSINKLLSLLENIYEENNENELIEKSLINLLINSIEKFDIASEEYSPEIRGLNNFLQKHIQEMKEEIIEFVEKNNGPNIMKSSIRKFINSINNISIWNIDENIRNNKVSIINDRMYKINNFYKNFIDNFINIFPNIILNEVDYNNVSIPNYYGFSQNHNSKLKKYIASYYEKLKSFYGVPTLLNILNSIQKDGKNLILLSENIPSYSDIHKDNSNDNKLKGIIDERTSRFLYEYLFLKIMISYINYSDDDNMIVTTIQKNIEITDIFSVDYIDENETKIDYGISSHNERETRLLTGNKKELKQNIVQLLIIFMEIFRNEKETIDINYQDIQDRVFKLREREKDMVTDRLKSMTDEQRDADTLLKITKQGLYSKALQKGLRMYDKDFYEEEQNLREEMYKAELKIRKNNRNVIDENIDIYLEDYLEEKNNDKIIEDEAYDMSYINEDFFNGNTDGVDAPEEEYEDYYDYN
jgi:hypothetical protein